MCMGMLVDEVKLSDVRCKVPHGGSCRCINYTTMYITGELMQSERDALLKLIQSLRHEYEAVQAAKLGQESEIQGLKVRPFCQFSVSVHAICLCILYYDTHLVRHFCFHPY